MPNHAAKSFTGITYSMFVYMSKVGQCSCLSLCVNVSSFLQACDNAIHIDLIEAYRHIVRDSLSPRSLRHM